MIFDMQNPMVLEGLLSYPDYVFNINIAKNLTIQGPMEIDTIQGSSNTSLNIGGAVNDNTYQENQ